MAKDKATMTKMQKVVLLLTFWFTSPTEEKYQLWQGFAGDIDLNENEILFILGDVVSEADDYVDWAALDPFIEKTNRSMN